MPPIGDDDLLRNLRKLEDTQDSCGRFNNGSEINSLKEQLTTKNEYILSLKDQIELLKETLAGQSQLLKDNTKTHESRLKEKILLHKNEIQSKDKLHSTEINRIRSEHREELLKKSTEHERQVRDILDKMTTELKLCEKEKLKLQNENSKMEARVLNDNPKNGNTENNSRGPFSIKEEVEQDEFGYQVVFGMGRSIPIMASLLENEGNRFIDKAIHVGVPSYSAITLSDTLCRYHKAHRDKDADFRKRFENDFRVLFERIPSPATNQIQFQVFQEKIKIFNNRYKSL